MENVNTPPDTIAVRKALLHHRRALADIRVATNLQQEFATPENEGKNSVSENFGDEISIELTNFDIKKLEKRVNDLIYYKNPGASALTVLAGACALSALRFILQGNHRISFVSMVCYTIIARMAYVTIKSIFSSNPRVSRLLGRREFIDKVSMMCRKGIVFFASIHDTYISAENPSMTLRACGGAWGLAIVANHIGILTALTVILLGLFTVPYAIQANKIAVKPLYGSLVKEIHIRWSLLALNRRQKNGVAFLVLIMAWFYTSWINRFIGLFMALLAIRCGLNAEEIKSIREQAAPLTMSVRKSASRFTRRLTMTANDFVKTTNGYHRGRQQ